jgi:hypothetical protein
VIWSAICLIVGLVVVAFGGVFVLAFFMPKFGGGTETIGTLVLGLFLMALGIGLTFYAGTLA